MTDAPLFSVIVPVWNGASVLPMCLDALEASDLDQDLWEVIVVDDGSTDASASIAHSRADAVVVLDDGPAGPGRARNRGAERARGSWLVFVDVDVMVHADTLSKLRGAIDGDPDIAAVFGAYDDTPRGTGFLSQYRNLYHRWVHLQGRGEASTFWAGLGAVRRDAFLQVGGFDAATFRRPQIEDIDLGCRLADAGLRILLRPDIEGTHLKEWTLVGMLRTDLFDRAIPWMRLTLRRRRPGGGSAALNLKTIEKVKTALVGLAVLGTALSLATQDGRWALAGGLALGVVVALNFPLYRWFARLRGLWFALGVIPMNLLYYLLCGVGAASGLIVHVLKGPDGAPAAAASLRSAHQIDRRSRSRT